MKKPIVGIMPLWDDERDSIWMLPGYPDGVSQAGAVPLILPLSTDKETLRQAADLCDGFLFTGGHDVSPALYRQAPSAALGPCCEKRDRMESRILKKALGDDKPILGICRGIQLINAVLGGTLYQDLPTQHPSAIWHHQRPPYDVPSHSVEIPEDSPLYACLQTPTLSVNSYHHQAVDRLAPGLRSMAVSPDGLTEALYMPGRRFLWAVQWHPEFSFRTDESSRRLFRAFVDAMLPETEKRAPG